MTIAIAFQFDVQPRPEQTSRACLEAIRGEVTDWLAGIFRGAGVHDLRLSFDSTPVSPLPGHEIRADAQDCASHQLACLDWTFPDARTPGVGWQFSCVLAADAWRVQVALAIQVQGRPYVLRALTYSLDDSNPLSSIGRLRARLLDGWHCQIEGQPVPTRAQLVRRNQVEAFVHERVLNSHRVLPVLLLTLGGPLQVQAEDVQQVQERLTGLAQVAFLPDQAAADRLTKILGPERSCQGGVRMYWPGFTAESPPDSHKFNSYEELRHALVGTSLAQQVFGVLAGLAAQEFREGRLIRAARAALAADRFTQQRTEKAAVTRLGVVEAELEQARQAQRNLVQEVASSGRHVRALLDQLAELREQLAALRAAPQPRLAPAGGDLDGLAEELERAWDENQRLKAEGEAARRRAADLETDFRNYLDSSALLWEPRDGPPDPEGAAGGRDYADAADALRAAADEFADVLTVWDDAVQSAGQSPFGSPAKVFQALKAIAEVGRDYFKARHGGPPLGPIERAFRSRVSFKYTAFESQTTLSLFGAERVFHDRDQHRQMLRHLTLGGGNTNNCLQIYFEFDDDSQRVLIGYCGRHLPYYRQRT